MADPHRPVQILRRPKTIESVDGPSMNDKESGIDEKGEKKKDGEQRKKHSFKKDDREKEKERDTDREKSQPKTVSTLFELLLFLNLRIDYLR